LQPQLARLFFVRCNYLVSRLRIWRANYYANNRPAFSDLTIFEEEWLRLRRVISRHLNPH